jgi:hypothetical protein
VSEKLLSRWWSSAERDTFGISRAIDVIDSHFCAQDWLKKSFERICNCGRLPEFVALPFVIVRFGLAVWYIKGEF